MLGHRKTECECILHHSNATLKVSLGFFQTETSIGFHTVSEQIVLLAKSTFALRLSC